MAARSRDSVERSPSSDSEMTYSRFFELFPDNRACLDYLRDRFYPAGSDCPKCGRSTKFHAIKGRSAYGCQYCGHQVYPTAGTIFHKSTTSMQLWFYGVFLMSSTRCGISAKQFGREIGVTYKTAHRMFKMIRTLLSDEGEAPLTGKVEVDETAGGAKHVRAGDSRRGLAMVKKSHRPTIWGAVERGGRVKAKVVKSRGTLDVEGPIHEHVLPASMIFTDEWLGYTHRVGERFAGHRRIKHEDRVYVQGDVHTQTIEGFFGLFKNGVRGVCHAISTAYLQNYLDEYSFRYNRRHSSTPMFWAMLNRVEKASQPPLAVRPLG